MSTIHVLHENDDWARPLFEALDTRGLPYASWFLDEGRVDPRREPPEGVFYNRQVMFKQHTTRGALLDQHRAINTALQARDAEGARAAVTAHLDYVEKALANQKKAERNEAIARQRFDHEKSR